jgi:N-acetylglutamate synthase-like GNAT family acetyltransferase
VNGDPEYQLAPATAADLDAVQALLLAAGLPLGGLERDFPGGFVVVRAGGSVVGCAGVERYGEDGLLRSVAVADAARGRGLGGRMVADRRAFARAGGLRTLYLLTPDAAGFFARAGFTLLPRDAASPEIRASFEFTALCPAATVCMSRPVAD